MSLLCTFKDRFGEGGVGEGVDQAKQLVVVELVLADSVKDALKLCVALFDVFQGIVY